MLFRSYFRSWWKKS